MLDLGRRPILVANVHLLPLPGSRNDQGDGVDGIAERAVEEAVIACKAGFDAVLLQNTRDGSWAREGAPETIAIMAVIGARVRKAVSCAVGFNVLAVGAKSSLAIASAASGSFVRIKVYVGAVMTPDGIVQASYEEALSYRSSIHGDGVAILADVYDRSSWPVGQWAIEEAARFAYETGRADGLVITGRSTEESMARGQAVKGALPEAPVVCGGGTTPDNIARMLTVFDGAIVGQGIKRGGALHEKFDRDLSEAYIRAARSHAP